jgi:hypothetical protein
MAHTKNGDDVIIGGYSAPSTNVPVPSRNMRPLPMARRGVPEGGGGGEGGSGTGGGGGDTSSPKSAKATTAPATGGIDFRQIFTGATLKKIIGLPNLLADVILAKISAPSGSTVTAIAPDKSDVYVTYKDIISGNFGIGRLFAPHSIFWRLPTNGSSAMVIKPSQADGTGIPYVLHGDGGNPRATPVPDWLDSNNCGIQAPEAVHIESTSQGVIIKSVTSNGSLTAEVYVKSDGSIDISGGQGANINIVANGGGNVVINGGVLAVARQTDTVTGTAGPYPIVNGMIASGAPNIKG